ncbi:MAG: NAD(P)-binding protein [Bdellovibrionota bacterium]
MRSYRIVGAGFSGLTLAYYLKKIEPEAPIVVVEKNSYVGGLLQTEKTPYGVAEKAANAMLDSEELRFIAGDIEWSFYKQMQVLKELIF